MSAFCGGDKESSKPSEKVTEIKKENPAASEVVTTVSKPEEAANITVVSSRGNSAADVELYKKSSISRQQLEESLKSYKEAGQNVDEKELLNSLIESELISQSLENDNVDIEALFNNYVLNAATYYASQMGVEFTSQEDVENFLIDNGTTLDDFALSLYGSFQSELIVNYIQSKYADKFENIAKPEIQSVMDFYQDNKDEFKASEKVKIAHIFFYVEDETKQEEAKALATSVYRQIRNGSLTFEKAVSDYTEDEATKENGGILGWVNLEESDFEKTIGIKSSAYHKLLFTEETFNKLFTLEEGQVSAVLESTQGYHIFKLIKHNPEKLLAVTDKVYPDNQATVYDFCENYILEAYSASLLERCYEDFVKDLKAQANIKIY